MRVLIGSESSRAIRNFIDFGANLTGGEASVLFRFERSN